MNDTSHVAQEDTMVEAAHLLRVLNRRHALPALHPHIGPMPNERNSRLGCAFHARKVQRLQK